MDRESEGPLHADLMLPRLRKYSRRQAALDAIWKGVTDVCIHSVLILSAIASLGTACPMGRVCALKPREIASDRRHKAAMIFISRASTTTTLQKAES